jgi:hypothetical protein
MEHLERFVLLEQELLDGVVEFGHESFTEREVSAAKACLHCQQEVIAYAESLFLFE